MNFKTAVVVFFSTWALYGIAKLLPEPFSKTSIGLCLSLIILISAFVSKRPGKIFGEELAFANKSFVIKVLIFLDRCNQVASYPFFYGTTLFLVLIGIFFTGGLLIGSGGKPELQVNPAIIPVTAVIDFCAMLGVAMILRKRYQKRIGESGNI